MSTEPKRIDWSQAPVVFIVLPTCCHCGSTQYTTTKSEANGDGSTTRKVLCRECGEPYKICCELPEFGNGHWPVSENDSER